MREDAGARGSASVRLRLTDDLAAAPFDGEPGPWTGRDFST